MRMISMQGGVAACPKPWSRKQLRQLMHKRHRELTADNVARFGHRPGKGRLRDRMLAQLAKFEEHEKAGALPEQQSGVLAFLKSLFRRE